MSLPGGQEGGREAQNVFEVFYKPYPFFFGERRLSEIDVREIGERYDVTLNFAKPLKKRVTLKVGSLEVSVREQMTGGAWGEPAAPARFEPRL